MNLSKNQIKKIDSYSDLKYIALSNLFTIINLL